MNDYDVVGGQGCGAVRFEILRLSPTLRLLQGHGQANYPIVVKGKGKTRAEAFNSGDVFPASSAW